MNRRSTNKENSFFVLKVIDGLFLANANAARDIEFLKNNKIKLIVNCAPSDIKFISNQEFIIQQFGWHDEQGNFIEQINENKTIQLTKKIHNCLNVYESVAFCSKKGCSRALTVCILYFFHQFQWTLYKALQFVNCKKSDLEVRASFLKLLVSYQSNLKQNKNYDLKDGWEVPAGKQEQQDVRIINNTYLNSRKGRQKIYESGQYYTKQRKSQKTVKVIQKFEIIPQVNNQKHTQTHSRTIHLDHFKTKLNQFLQQKQIKHSIYDHRNSISKQQKKLPIHRRKKLSQKCLTQEFADLEYSANKFDTKQIRIKRSITPITKSRQIQKDNQIQKKIKQDSLPKFPSSVVISKTSDVLDKSKRQSDVYNLSINVCINSVNFYKQKSNKISSYNRDKLKVYLNRSRRKSFLSVTQKEKRSRTSIRSQSIPRSESERKDISNSKERSNSARKRKFLSMTQ